MSPSSTLLSRPNKEESILSGEKNELLEPLIMEDKGESSCEEDVFIPPPPSWFRFDFEEEKADGGRGEEEEESSCGECSGDGTNSESIIGSLLEQEPVSASVTGAPGTSLPIAARELVQTAFRRSLHYSLLLYSTRRKRYRRHTDLGSVGGYPADLIHHPSTPQLPPFSSLPWSDRQLVKEWRTIVTDFSSEEEADFARAKILLPRPVQPPKWKKGLLCFQCRKPFHAGMLRHHCRLCGESFCNEHSSDGHCLPHLGYDPDVPERICAPCKQVLEERDLAERIAWRMARCRDYFEQNLTPYFETGVDTMEDAALRIAQYTIQLTRQIPLGAQATVAVETVEVLRRHGLKGIYGLVLRKEFMAAADLLCKVAGINEKSWPLSVHELSASVFYALAQHRWLRGVDPEKEEWCHTLINMPPKNSSNKEQESMIDETDTCPMAESVANLLAMADYTIQTQEDNDDIFGPFLSAEALPPPTHKPPIAPVCTPLPTNTLCSLLFYAPLALEFIYVQNSVDMQLLAAQQHWNLLFAHLEQVLADDRPASALFIHKKQKIACFAVRGTATVQDVVTDIRAMPVPFPECGKNAADGWDVLDNPGLALHGMARAANHLFAENVDVLLTFAKKGYRIRIVGHSLGGGVAALLGILMRQALEKEAKLNDSLNHSLGSLDNPQSMLDSNDLLRVYAYGTPACIDTKLADYTASFVTSVVLHDDVVPRLTPTSIRKLIKHLLYVRETWVKTHFNQDVNDVVKRVRRGWAPRWRGSFVLLGNKLEKKKIPKNAGRVIVKNGKIFGCKDNMSVSWKDAYVSSEKIDGEVFYEAEENLIESDDSDDELEIIENGDLGFVKRNHQRPLKPVKELDEFAVPFDEPAITPPDDNTPPPVLLEEAPLPRMFIPGKIAHIYTHNGGYKATFVPRSFRELRRISLAGNMLADHMSRNYYEALLEVKSIRKAPYPFPNWSGFATSNTCSCCASRFTWASTCESEAQEARDKHNCRSCGSLVCDPCSKNCVPLPKYGITVPVRVCDCCYHDLGGVLDGGGCSEEMMRSYLAVKEEEDETMEGKKKRSLVDDLASRIHSSSLSVAN